MITNSAHLELSEYNDLSKSRQLIVEIVSFERRDHDMEDWFIGVTVGFDF